MVYKIILRSLDSEVSTVKDGLTNWCIYNMMVVLVCGKNLMVSHWRNWTKNAFKMPWGEHLKLTLLWCSALLGAQSHKAHSLQVEFLKSWSQANAPPPFILCDICFSHKNMNDKKYKHTELLLNLCSTSPVCISLSMPVLFYSVTLALGCSVNLITRHLQLFPLLPSICLFRVFFCILR